MKLAYLVRYNGILAHITILRVEQSPLGFTVHFQLNPVFSTHRRKCITTGKKPSLKIQVAMSLIPIYSNK